MNSVTVVCTASNRPELLRRTMASFDKFNTYQQIERILVRDDFREEHVGQIKSCEILYAQVKTPWVFHIEDDWEFNKPGFIEACFSAWEPNVHSAWVRNEDDFDGYHRVKPHTDGKFVIPNTISHGFSFNPHLYDMKYYDGFTKQGGVTPEDSIGVHYTSRGLRAIWVPGYCHHIG